MSISALHTPEACAVVRYARRLQAKTVRRPEAHLSGVSPVPRSQGPLISLLIGSCV